MKTFNYLIVAVSLITNTILVTSPVFAQDVTPTPDAREMFKARSQQALEDKTEAMAETRQEHVDAVCEKLTARINNRLNSYEESKDKWHSRYQGIIKRLESLNQKLDEKDCDTSQIDADITTFQSLLDEFAAAFRVFVTQLQGSRAYVCGESQGDFSNQLTTARAKLAPVKSAASNLHNFVQSTLKPHLRLVKNNCQPTTPTRGEE
jgi:chromosome segregation ATPase